MKLTDEAIDAATRVYCCGLPLPEQIDSDLKRLAHGLCLGPHCGCWESGRELTRTAIEAALSIQGSR